MADPENRSETDARGVAVPMRVYKTVTVFSTLFAVVGVVGGFVLLDVATDRAQTDLAGVDPLVALAGVGLIVLSAAVYAFSTRFQPEEMRNPKDNGGEDPPDG